MNILVIGATGFTGSHVVALLLEQNARIHCLVRPTSDSTALPVGAVNLIVGDLSDSRSLREAMDGKDVLINTASLGFGHASNIVRAAVEAGVKRALFFSTTAIFTGLNAKSKSVRLAAEEIIRESSLDYTIFRPTMIYGSSRDRNMSRLIRYLLQWPIVPILGNGQYLQQPVYVGDVAAAVVQALMSGKTVRKSYNLSGAMPLTFDQIIDSVCHVLKRKVVKVHLPSGPVVLGLRVMERLWARLPITAEQVLRLNEHKSFDYSAAAEDFGYEPRSFSEGIYLELQEMRVV